jgi:hypothetical protein
MSLVTRFLDWINLKPKSKMSKENFQPNNIIRHRYQKQEILVECLKSFSFREKDWTIRVVGY